MNKYMKKAFLIGMSTMLMASTMLTGCSLAKKSGNTSGDGNLCGVYVVVRGEEEFNNSTYDVISEKGTNGRYYAEIKGDYEEIIFPDLPGYLNLLANVPDSDGEAVATFYAADEICDSNTSFNVGDTTTETQLSSTLYYSTSGAAFSSDDEGNKEAYITVNPVYQDAEGQIYLTQGDNYLLTELGGSLKVTLTDSKETKEGTEAKKKSTVVAISVENKQPGEKIRVLQMSAKHAVLAEKTFTMDKAPETIKKKSNTAYVIVETMYTDADGKNVTERKLYENVEDETYFSLSVYKPNSDGILRRHDITVK